MPEFIKNWSWLLVPVIALGGLFWPQLGLLLFPIMLTLMGIGLFRGKYWCGNICPHGSLFDRIIAPFSRGRKIPGLFHSPFWRWGFFIFFMGMFILRLNNVFQHWGAFDFWERLGFIMVLNYLMPTLLGMGLGLAVKPRAWCKFCPMGTAGELSYRLGQRLGLTRFRDLILTGNSPDSCAQCGLCDQVCPVELQPQTAIETKTLQDPACLKCGLCTGKCPRGLLSLQTPDQIKDKKKAGGGRSAV